jgi:hypothetical protein
MTRDSSTSALLRLFDTGDGWRLGLDFCTLAELVFFFDGSGIGDCDRGLFDANFAPSEQKKESLCFAEFFVMKCSELRE